MGRKSISDDEDLLFRSMPKGIWDIDLDDPTTVIKILKKVESETRSNAKVDHAAMRRKDPIRIAGYLRVLAVVATKHLLMKIAAGDDKIALEVFKVAYSDNKVEMRKMLKLDDVPEKPEKSDKHDLKEKMGKISKISKRPKLDFHNLDPDGDENIELEEES
jgi:hypothetical protein